jgi:hypothetical protein
MRLTEALRLASEGRFDMAVLDINPSHGKD